VVIEPTPIDGLFVLRSATHADERGFFREVHRTDKLAEALGRPIRFVQGNHARSVPGVVRGFHAEPWDKLVSVVRGTALCAVADLRPTSPGFGTVATFLIGDEPGTAAALFVTEGLGNAYAAVTEVDYRYEVTAAYHQGVDNRGVAADDPDLGVVWPVADPIRSAADRRLPTLRQRYPDHPRWGG